MFDSVRFRLTLWYSAVLALVLVSLAAISYFIFWQSTVKRTDSDLEELAEAFLVTVQSELEGEAGEAAVKRAAQEAIVEHRFKDHVFTVVNAKGEVLISSRALAKEESQETQDGETPSETAVLLLGESAGAKGQRFGLVRGGRGGYRGIAQKFVANGDSYTLVALRSLHPQQEMLEEIRHTFAWIIPIALALASCGGYFLARKSLAPVVAMSSQARLIGAANLHERLAVQNARDELGQLAGSFNGLLDRLAESFERQQRFMADASHELRTPVAILRGESEVVLSRKERNVEEYRESLKVLHGESLRLTRIVENLFTLTRADAGQYPLQKESIYLDELVADCVHSARTLASAKEITLHVEAAEEMPAVADPSLARRMILNLLDNAIKYTPASGRVTVRCERQGTHYAIRIEDTGAGIAPELHGKIFERFFRADKARSRAESDGSGAGLGLAIATWIADAHQGRIELTQSNEKGSVFTVFLPGPDLLAGA